MRSDIHEILELRERPMTEPPDSVIREQSLERGLCACCRRRGYGKAYRFYYGDTTSRTEGDWDVWELSLLGRGEAHICHECARSAQRSRRLIRFAIILPISLAIPIYELLVVGGPGIGLVFGAIGLISLVFSGENTDSSSRRFDLEMLAWRASRDSLGIKADSVWGSEYAESTFRLTGKE